MNITGRVKAPIKDRWLLCDALAAEFLLSLFSTPFVEFWFSVRKVRYSGHIETISLISLCTTNDIDKNTPFCQSHHDCSTAAFHRASTRISLFPLFLVLGLQMFELTSNLRPRCRPTICVLMPYSPSFLMYIALCGTVKDLLTHCALILVIQQCIQSVFVFIDSLSGQDGSPT